MDAPVDRDVEVIAVVATAAPSLALVARCAALALVAAPGAAWVRAHVSRDHLVRRLRSAPTGAAVARPGDRGGAGGDGERGSGGKAADLVSAMAGGRGDVVDADPNDHDDRAPAAAPPGAARQAGGRYLAALIGLVGRLGEVVRRPARRPPDAAADRRLGVALLVAAASLAMTTAPLGLAVGVLVWSMPAWRARAVVRHERRAAVDEVPEVVDLLRLALASGLNLHLALAAVATSSGGPVTAALRRVDRRARRGDRLADALAELEVLGDPARGLAEALLAAERYGVPVLPALERAGDDARLVRRRDREEATRRLPVKLLFPLVLCTLPALGLLVVVPLVARSLPSLAP